MLMFIRVEEGIIVVVFQPTWTLRSGSTVKARYWCCVGSSAACAEGPIEKARTSNNKPDGRNRGQLRGLRFKVRRLESLLIQR